MRRRDALRRRASFLFAQLLTPLALSAQESDPAAAGASGLAGFAEVSVRAASVHGSVRPLLGIGALLQLGDFWRAGGAGLVFSGAIDLKSEGPFAGSKLHMGYGGVIVERGLSELSFSSSPSSLTGRMLWGIGNASVRDPVTRVRFLSDNFFIAEPSLTLATQLHPRVNVGVLAAYRIALGVQDLDRVDGTELRGWALGLSLRVGPF